MWRRPSTRRARPGPRRRAGGRTVSLAGVTKRYVGIRAIDEQGNVGRIVSVEVRGADGTGGGPGSGGQSGGGEAESSLSGAPSGGSGSGDAGAPSGGAPTAPIPG